LKRSDAGKEIISESDRSRYPPTSSGYHSPQKPVICLTDLSSLSYIPNRNIRQLEFLRLLKDFLIEREKVEKRDLIQSPFTIIHPQGIRGVFRPAEIDEILQLTEQLAA